MKDRFDQILQHLGHLYWKRPDGETQPNSGLIRHIGQVYIPTDEILTKTLCSPAPQSMGMGHFVSARRGATGKYAGLKLNCHPGYMELIQEPRCYS